MPNQIIYEQFKHEESQDYSSIPERKLLTFNQIFIRYILSLVSNKLVPFSESDREIGLKNKLTFRNPLEFIPDEENETDSETSGRSKKIALSVIRAVFFMVFFYGSYCIFLVAIFQFRHDLALNDWKPKVKENSFRTEKCALKEDIYFEDEKGVEANITLIETNLMLKKFGAPAPTLKGITTIWLGSLCMTPFFFVYLVVYIVLNYDIRVDVMSYNLNFNCEKKRIHRDLCQVIDCMINSTKYRAEYCDGQLGLIELDSGLKVENYNATLLSPKPFNYLTRNNFVRKMHSNENLAGFFEVDLVLKYYHEQNSSNLIDSIKIIDRGEAKLLFIETLLNPKVLKLAEPSVLSLRWFRRMTLITFFYRIFVISIGLIVIASMILYSIMGENFNKAKFRLEQIECLNWHPNGTVIMNKFQLNEPSEEDIESYSYYYDEFHSFESLLKLASYVELNYYFTTEVVIFYLCLFFTLGPMTLLLTNNCTMYVQDFIFNHVWLHEIGHQIDECTRIMIEHKLLKESKSVKIDDSIESSHEEIMIALVVSYINYELFRKQQTHHGILVYFCLVLVVLLMGLIITLCLFVGITLDDCLSLAVFGTATFTVMYGNFFLATCAIRTSQFEHFTKKVTNMLAKTTSTGIELWHIRKLWARQLLNNNDIMQLFTPSFFSVYVTKKNVLAVNGYFVTFWWIYLNTLQQR